jgi:TPR repeat protein
MVSMDKPLFRRWFSRPQPPVLETTEPEAEPGEAEAAGPSDAQADPVDANAQFSRGLKCANGHGAAPDYAQAARWYLKAANQSHPLAQFNLGVMYARGQGMPRDEAKSQMWIHKAAQLGDAGAQYNLGMSHHRASYNGLPQDAPESRIEAYKWFQLAAAQGYQGSEVGWVRVTQTMTREDVAEGGRRVVAFGAAPASQVQPPES